MYGCSHMGVYLSVRVLEVDLLGDRGFICDECCPMAAVDGCFFIPGSASSLGLFLQAASPSWYYHMLGNCADLIGVEHELSVALICFTLYG